ncbi:MAG: carbohydrate deacetylase [Nitriliruptorales bacterium]
MGKHLIVNADDFGASRGVNRGIIEAHTNGIVTSASMMVTGRAVKEAVSLSREHPTLSVGLHWDVWGEDEREFDIHDVPAVRVEFQRQLDEFQRLMGGLPTHIDTHRHAHFFEHLTPVFEELVAPLDRPLRGSSKVRFVGGFYAHWEWLDDDLEPVIDHDLEHVSVAYLEKLLRDEIGEGWTELSCHPGYVTDDYRAVYLSEREAELTTLTHPRAKEVLDELGIQLVSYHDLLDASSAS